MKRDKTAIAVVMCVNLAASSAGASPIHCFLEVNSDVYLNGICNFEGERDGNFSIGTGGRTRSKYFAYVRIDTQAGVARGYWNGPKGASHAHWELGELVRQGACWMNDHAKVCARK